ncbi:MAG TPA: ABC transporter permease [Gemmatimonadota bacterium]|nr:ABC transporter permease [Gemmatimonadota bacterium]
MRLASILRDLIWDLGHQRLRTSLTVLGIAWGTVSVVVLLAFGVGLERQTIKRFHGLGERIVLLFGGRTTEPWQGFPDGRTIRLREEDAALLAGQIPGITEISPEYSSRAVPVRHGRNSANPNITGVDPVYGRLRNVIPAAGGRFLDRLDVEGRRRVAVLGDELAALLFGDERPLGKRVYVGDVPFTVVGVMVPKQQNSSYNSRDKDRIFIPASTHRAVIGNEYVSDLVYRTRDPRLTKAVERRVYELLGRKYRFSPDDKDALMVWDTSRWETQFSYLFLGFNLFFAIVGCFTLSVGGVGVANIMYIVVKERTREIGIRRSVGARPRDILVAFFAETFAIVGLGALLGFGLSVGIVQLLGLVPMQDFVGTPTISKTVLLVTVALLGVIGFVAGLFPARRAASLDPVECLRT